MTQTLLMCSPEGFAVDYEINPWMQGHVGAIDKPCAERQWQTLRDKLATLARIEVMPGDRAWPDLVFTANAGLPIIERKVFVLSNFRHAQRQGEKEIDRRWFAARGWQCVELDAGIRFEGAGDALFDSRGRLFVADGTRTDRAAAAALRQHAGGDVETLKLIDPNFYHLDTCFCPLANGHAIYLPGAFDEASQDLLRLCFGDGLIALTPDEGRLFCANAVNVGDVVVINETTPRLARVLGDAGFTVVATPLTEFMKSGGSAKCLTLRIA